MLKVFKFKTVPAPWNGEGAVASRIDLGNALRSVGPIGKVGRDGVYWTEGHNSYVLVAGETFYQPELGVTVDLLSINGGGEVRWDVDVNPEGEVSTFDRDGPEVAKGFGLTD